MFIRDPEREKEALQLFIKERNREPNTQAEQDMVIRASGYPEDQLPDRLKGGTPASLGMQGIARYGAQGALEESQQKAIDWTAGGPTGINTLQSALKKKVGAGTPEGQAIGPSETFKKAGLTGYGSLAASLTARGNEIDAGYKKYTNWIDGAIAGWGAEQTRLQENAKTALESYKIEMEEYNRLADQITEKENNIIKNEQALKLHKDKTEFDAKYKKEMFLFEQANKATAGAKTITVKDELTYWAEQEGLNVEQLNNVRYDENPPEWFKVDKTIFGEKGAEVSRIPTAKDVKKEWSKYKKEALSKKEAKAVELTPQEIKRMSISENSIPEDVSRQINARKLRSDSDEMVIRELVDSKKYTQEEAEAIMKTYNDTLSTQPSMAKIDG